MRDKTIKVAQKKGEKGDGLPPSPALALFVDFLLLGKGKKGRKEGA